MNKEIVSDTGPLISLEKLDNGFDLMRGLYERIIVPPKVIEEITEGTEGNRQNYLKKYGVEDFITIQEIEFIPDIPGIRTLHEGEAQAISLAWQLNLPLLIEELKGRKIASSAKIRFSGIAKQVVVAYKNGVITNDDAHKNLKKLLYKNRINKIIYDALFLQIEYS